MFLTKCPSAPLTSKALTEYYTKGWEFISCLSYTSPTGEPKFIYYFKRIFIPNNNKNNEGNETRVC